MADWPYDADTLPAEARRLVPHADEARLSPSEADALGRDLAAGIEVWWPSPARLFRVKKRSGGERVLGKPVRADRVVQRAMLLDLDRLALPPAGVTAYVRGRGAFVTIAWLERQLHRSKNVAWSLDVIDFYPSIDRGHLRALVPAVVPDGLTRALVLRSMQQPVEEGWATWIPERGLLQGAVLSGWLSNLALRGVDQRFAGPHVHRYCDNVFVVGSEAEVRRRVVGLVAALGELGLRVRLRPKDPSPASIGLDCLGHRISAYGRAPGKDRMADFFARLATRLSRDPAEAASLARGHRAFYGERTWRGVMEIDDLLRAGRFAEARARLAAEQEKLALIDEALELSAEETAMLLAAVAGDPGRHVELKSAGRVVVSRGLRPGDLRRHRAGEVSLGALPVDRMGFAHVGVVDVDGGDSRADALRLATAVRAAGHPAVVEDTGGRGHHVWIPQAGPEPVARVMERLAQASAAAGPAPMGVKRELFPAPPDADPAVRLPLGVHPRTGRRSHLLGPGGRSGSMGQGWWGC